MIWVLNLIVFVIIGHSCWTYLKDGSSVIKFIILALVECILLSALWVLGLLLVTTIVPCFGKFFWEANQKNPDPEFHLGSCLQTSCKESFMATLESEFQALKATRYHGLGELKNLPTLLSELRDRDFKQMVS